MKPKHHRSPALAEVREKMDVENDDSSSEKERLHSRHKIKRRKAKKLKISDSSDNKCEETESTCGNKAAIKYFQWLISPLTEKEFFQDIWEKKCVHVSRPSDGYQVLTLNDIDEMLHKHFVEYSTHIDVVTYTDGVKTSHNLKGKAYAPAIWKFYEEGCSIRLRNPQLFIDSVWKVNSYLQEYFGTFVGANVYLTPPGSQGFAPHYDDIEAFVLQLEGKKHWRVYSPRNENENLPRFSSRNFTEEEIGDPVLEVTLHPGDLLYFPRGFIHQAKTSPHEHSLHITISANQKNTYGDLLSLMIPQAIEIAMENDVEFRQSLPKNYMDCVGNGDEDQTSEEGMEMRNKIFNLADKLVSNYLPIEASVDEMAQQHIHSSLPPFLSAREKCCSIHGEQMNDGGNFCVDGLNVNTPIRLIRKRAVKTVIKDGKPLLYHTLENSLSYQEWESSFVELSSEELEAVDDLIKFYPTFIRIKNLPFDNNQRKVEFARKMYTSGLVMVKQPLDATNID